MSDDVDDLAARLRALSPEERVRLLAQVGLSPTVPPADIDVSGAAETVQQVNLASGSSVGQVVARQEHHYHPGETDLAQRRTRYLEHLAAQQDALPLQGIAERPDRGERLALHRVYTLLAVQSRDELPDLPLAAFEGGDPRQPLRKEFDPDWALPDAALSVDRVHDARGEGAPRLSRSRLAATVVVQHDRLVLLGDPGSGKSTFVRHLAWGLAERALHGDATAALPVILPLRTLAGCLSQGGPLPLAVLAALRAAIAECCVQQADDVLESALAVPAALLLLDGLDEVPLEATARSADRETTLRAVQAFLRLHRGARALITCRTRAFDNGLRAALGWPVETLAPFTLGQVRYFARAWYAELAAKGQVAQAQVARLGEALPAAITNPQRTRLREMAETPLLLTMMALVLANEGELPRDRPQLYQRILLLLLGQWDKTGKQGQSLFEAAGLPDWGSERILPLLDRLSYEAHRDVRSEDGRGRIGRGDLYVALLDFFTQARAAQPGEAARVALAYVEQRSGLLSADGPQSYAFAHLTLQEYCAGRYLALNEEPPTGSTLPPDPVALAMGHRVADRWREPIMLGAGLMRQRDLDALLCELIDREEKDAIIWYRDLILAAEIGRDRDWGYLSTGRVVKVVAHQWALRGGLVALLADSAQPLPVGERVRAGFLLGDLGDSRFPVTVEEWRAELARAGQPRSYFCWVRAGEYIIGSSDHDPDANDNEKPQHTVTLDQPFLIARYPVTNEQWSVWVAQGGKASTYDDDSDLNHRNQPVVGVSWTMVKAFCAWLSGQLGVTVRLPSEAEWEVAAAYAERGQRRRYPWGDEWRDDHAATEENQEARGVAYSVPVGCYPAGAAPCGAMDMAGNVWEWTADVWQSYPGAEKGFTEGDGRAVRGGSSYNDRTNVRCGARGRSYLSIVSYSNGFRVVLAPAFIADSR